MKIKQLIPISNDYAVLATDDYDYKHICYDRKLDDVHFFWAVLDGGEYEHDAIALIQVSEDGSYEICERNLVVERQVCPICGQKFSPSTARSIPPPPGRIVQAAVIGWIPAMMPRTLPVPEYRKSFEVVKKMIPPP